ncbi:hypothetical protein Emag_002830 [Eimeria magna]
MVLCASVAATEEIWRGCCCCCLCACHAAAATAATSAAASSIERLPPIAATSAHDSRRPQASETLSCLSGNSRSTSSNSNSSTNSSSSGLVAEQEDRKREHCSVCCSVTVRICRQQHQSSRLFRLGKRGLTVRLRAALLLGFPPGCRGVQTHKPSVPLLSLFECFVFLCPHDARAASAAPPEREGSILVVWRAPLPSCEATACLRPQQHYEYFCMSAQRSRDLLLPPISLLLLRLAISLAASSEAQEVVLLLPKLHVERTCLLLNSPIGSAPASKNLRRKSSRFILSLDKAFDQLLVKLLPILQLLLLLLHALSYNSSQQQQRLICCCVFENWWKFAVASYRYWKDAYVGTARIGCGSPLSRGAAKQYRNLEQSLHIQLPSEVKAVVHLRRLLQCLKALHRRTLRKAAMRQAKGNNSSSCSAGAAAVGCNSSTHTQQEPLQQQDQHEHEQLQGESQAFEVELHSFEVWAPVSSVSELKLLPLARSKDQDEVESGSEAAGEQRVAEGSTSSAGLIGEAHPTYKNLCLVAGEVGVSIGRVYTSLTAFTDADSAGSVQIAAARLLLRARKASPLDATLLRCCAAASAAAAKQQHQQAAARSAGASLKARKGREGQRERMEVEHTKDAAASAAAGSSTRKQVNMSELPSGFIGCKELLQMLGGTQTDTGGSSSSSSGINRSKGLCEEETEGPRSSGASI